MIVCGRIAITCLLLLIGGLETLENNRTGLQAAVGFMSFWGFLFQLTLRAVAYAVIGETPTPRLRQKTYSINVMSNTAAACLVTQLVPVLINPGNANLGAKVAFVFFARSVPLPIYLYFCFPEMKGHRYLELEMMFQKGQPARRFKDYKCEVEGLEKPVTIVHDVGLNVFHSEQSSRNLKLMIILPLFALTRRAYLPGCKVRVLAIFVARQTLPDRV
jgi:hypothetical protein